MIDSMSAPFSKVFADEIKISVPNIRAIIDGCKAGKQTGVIRHISEGGKSLYLLLKRGNVIDSYLVTPETRKTVSSKTWDAWIDSAGDSHAKFIPLSAQGLLIFKVLIQNITGKTQTFMQQAAVVEYLESQKKTQDASLVHLEWGDSMGAVFFFSPLESPYSLFISPETLYDQSGIAPAILNSQYPNCTVTTIGFDSSVDAWREYLLRRVFADICERTLARFHMVTGRALVDSLIRLTMAFASRQSLDIGISSYKVVDGEIFSSPDEAADAYRLLLTEMLRHFSGTTGSRLLSSTLRETVMNLSAHEREIVSKYSLFTEGYIYDRRT